MFKQSGDDQVYRFIWRFIQEMQRPPTRREIVVGTSLEPQSVVETIRRLQTAGILAERSLTPEVLNARNQERSMPYWRKDPMVELEEITRQTADELVDSIVWTAQSEVEVQELVRKVIGWMQDQFNHVQWSDYANRFGVDLAQQLYEEDLPDLIHRFASLDVASDRHPLDRADDESPPFLTLISRCTDQDEA